MSKNIEKAIEYFKKAHKVGNCMSSYHLYLIYGKEETFKDVKLAYYYLEKAITSGVTAFDEYS